MAKVLSLIIFEPEWLAAHKICAGHCRAPVLFNVFGDQVIASEVRHKRSFRGVVHRVCHITHQYDVLALPHHLAN
jgi:hypothetical protein